MNIYSHTPYTYRIKWTATGMNYYGVRYARGCQPSDFWVTYFTSSKKVSEYRKIHGDPDVIEIRKTFTSDNKINESREFETRVLRRLHVHKRADYLNAGINKGIPPMIGDDNPMKNSEVRKKHLAATQNIEHRLRQSASVRQRVESGTHHFLGETINKTRVKNGTHQLLGGTIQGETSRRRVKEGTHNFLGGEAIKKKVDNGSHQWLGPASNNKMLELGIHPSQIKVTCPHCSRTVSKGMFVRWHDSNCRTLLDHQAKK